MSLIFCPVCNKLLQIKSENGNNIAFCTCGFKRFSGVELEASEKTHSNLRQQGVATDNNSEGITHICKKCGNDKAEIIDLGERMNNESSVYIFKCLKCGYSERQSGTGAGS